MKPLVIILLVFLGSCNHILVPTWYNTKDHQLPTEKVENEWVSIYVENLESKKDLLIFDVEVINRSRHPLHFNPSEIYYYASSTPLPELEDLGSQWEERTTYTKYKSINPEEVNHYYKKKIQGKKVASGLLMLANVGMAAYGAAGGFGGFGRIDNSVSGSAQAWKEAGLIAGMFGADIARTEVEESKQRLQEDLEYLPDEMLTETWIPAEKTIRGKVYFEKNQSFRYYRFLIPIEDETFVYDFKVASSMETSLIHSIRRKNGY